MSKPTRDQITLLKQKIDKDPATAFRVLAAIWDRQQPSEKETGKYAGSDGKGFQWAETEYANALYQKFVEADKKWMHMSPVDVVRCQLIVKKYVKQYLSAEVDERDREIQRFKVNKHPPREKLSPEARKAMWEGIERMAKRHNV